MSKSKGNVISPMSIIEQYGSDALRAGLITGQTAGNNQLYNEANIRSARNFCNKLWNIARFVEDKTGGKTQPSRLKPKNTADRWILHKLDVSIKQITSHIEEYRFSDAYDSLYHFVWDDFADWYIEASKTQENLPVLVHCLDQILRLAHPFVPFVSETIWQTLGWTGQSLLITSKWPKPDKKTAKAGQDFEDIKNIVQEVRFIKNSLNLKNAGLLHKYNDFIQNNSGLIEALAGVEVRSLPQPEGIRLIQSKHACWLEVEQQDIERFKSQLKAEVSKQTKTMATLEERLKTPAYAKNAPKQLVKETEALLDKTRSKLANLKEQLAKY